MKRNKLIARYIALHGVRNSELENLHSGITPSTKTGDYSDVKVVTPFGEIPWTKISRISNKEMRKLMLDVEKRICYLLDTLPKLEKQAGSAKAFEKVLKIFFQSGASWDVSEKEMISRYGPDYKIKLKITE